MSGYPRAPGLSRSGGATPAWPFLIGRGREAGYQLVAAPGLMAGRTAQDALLELPTDRAPSSAHDVLVCRVPGRRVTALTAVYRVFEPTFGDYGLDGDGPLRDGSGRRFRVIEGALVPVRRWALGAPTGLRGLVQAAHSSVLPVFREFWRSEEVFEPRPVGPIPFDRPAGHVPTRGAAVAAAGVLIAGAAFAARPYLDGPSTPTLVQSTRPSAADTAGPTAAGTGTGVAGPTPSDAGTVQPLASDAERLVVSADGLVMAAAGRDGRIRVLLVTGDGDTTQLLTDPVGPVVALAISPDGSRIAAAAEDGSVRLWDAGVPAPGATTQLVSPAEQLAFGPDPSVVVIRCRDGSVLRWQVGR